jgi:3-hydroxyisobutyrate dehydrogenase
VTEDAAAAYTPESTTLGVVGAGAMGSGIAGSMLRAGYRVFVHDTRHDAVARMVAFGASPADDLADLATRCDVVAVVVLDDPQVSTVVGTLLDDPRRIATIVVCSTVLPKTVVKLGERAAAAGVSLVDAPVSGGAEKSSRGTLTLLVGAEDIDMKRCAPVFDAIGRTIFHVGPVGAGSAGKLVNNLLAMGQYVVQLEAMQLADAYGISEDTAVGFITVSAGDSHGIRTWGRYDRLRTTHTLAGTPAMYELTAKDLHYAALAASQRDVDLPVTTVLAEAIGPKLISRDALIAARGGLPPERLCSGCGQELAYPFLAAAAHPQCPRPGAAAATEDQ